MIAQERLPLSEPQLCVHRLCYARRLNVVGRLYADTPWYSGREYRFNLMDREACCQMHGNGAGRSGPPRRPILPQSDISRNLNGVSLDCAGVRRGPLDRAVIRRPQFQPEFTPDEQMGGGIAGPRGDRCSGNLRRSRPTDP
jgi:hypothetical protein